LTEFIIIDDILDVTTTSVVHTINNLACLKSIALLFQNMCAIYLRSFAFLQRIKLSGIAPLIITLCSINLRVRANVCLHNAAIPRGGSTTFIVIAYIWSIITRRAHALTTSTEPFAFWTATDFICIKFTRRTAKHVKNFNEMVIVVQVIGKRLATDAGRKA